MTKKLKIILIFLAVCLVGVGIWYFSNTWKGDETQTVQNLKLLNSHSHPEAGGKWGVSFETIGKADLTITPEDQDTINDLDFVSLTCNGEERTPQILENDEIFYHSWECLPSEALAKEGDGKGELTHLVNVARKHTLKFRFGDKAAFAYNNPDSVTDTFNDESKIASKSNITVSGGQVKLSTCKDNGTSCSAAGECCSNYCVDGVCCNNACSGTCQACVASKTGGSNGTCANITNNTDPDSECAGTCKVCQSGACGNATVNTDPENECATASPPAANSCKSPNCSGADYGCGYLTAGEQSQPACKRCSGSSYDPVNFTNNTQDGEGSNLCNNTTGTCKACQSGACGNADVDTDPGNQCAAGSCTVMQLTNPATPTTCTSKCGTQSQQTGNCDGAGACKTVACGCTSIGTDGGGTNGYIRYAYWDGYNWICADYTGKTCADAVNAQGQTCETILTEWTYCKCSGP